MPVDPLAPLVDLPEVAEAGRAGPRRGDRWPPGTVFTRAQLEAARDGRPYAEE